MHIRTAVAAAYGLGCELDLSACVYGPGAAGRFRAEPMSYYHWLAGLAQLTRADRIVEIGTHYGGSARAFAEGQRAAGRDPAILTFDVEDRAGAPVVGQPGVERVLADVRSPEGSARLREWAGGQRIDIAYIDALKDCEFVESTVAALTGFDIGWLVFDDIFANRSIRTAWDRLRAVYGDRAITVDEVEIGIRSGGYGQGAIALHPDVLGSLATDPAVPRRLRAAARRKWSAVLPPAGTPSEPRAAAGPRELPAELDLLRSAVARCSGGGEIVVLGAASGTTTRTLAEALDERTSLRDMSITVIADFRNTTAAVSRVREDSATPARESFLDDFRRRLGSLASSVNLVAGDVPSLRWTGRPIELLVLGWHRTEAEIAAAFTELLPHCVPGGSLVVAEDFGNECAPFLHACVGRLLDHSDIVGFVPNALVLAPISMPDPKLLHELSEATAAESAVYVDRLDAALGNRAAKRLIERARARLRAAAEPRQPNGTSSQIRA